MQLASAVTNSGIAIDCETMDGRVRLRLTTPIGWTERHKAFGWSAHGMTELVSLAGVDPTSELLFSLPSSGLDGICIFHRTAWLGSAIFGGDAMFEASAFLANAREWPGALMLAVRGHLPVLDLDVASSITGRLRNDGGRGVAALCQTPQDSAHAHVLGCLLETWDPKPKLAEVIIDQFIKDGADGTPQITVLERLAADAPCSAVRLIAHGLHARPYKERILTLERLIRKLLPSETLATYSPTSNPSLAAWAEQALLDQALMTTGFDHNFLASKVDASVASVAWANASAAASARYDPNLATCLTIAPIRRWLAVHLLARLAILLR